MRAIQTIRNLALGLAVAGLLAGCDDDGTGPGTGATVRLAFRVGAGTGGASPALFAVSCEMNAPGLTCTDDATPTPNVLSIDRVQLVLREIELERVETDDCDTAVDEDACEKFESGPHLIDLPLNGIVEVTNIVTVVGDGTYDEVEFDIHKLDDDDPADLATLEEWMMDPDKGDFTDISIRVSTNFNDAGFQNFESDLNEEQEIELLIPVTVSGGDLTQLIGITFEVDLASWFQTADGTLIDPLTANKGGPNENLVKDNIRNSIEGYRDDDHDGVAHEDDTDEDD